MKKPLIYSLIGIFLFHTVLLVFSENSRRLKEVQMYKLSEIREPSGLCYNPEGNTLFVVGDRGDVAEISLDGTVLNHVFFPDRDFEGVVLLDGVLYVLDENNFQILKLEPISLEPLSEHNITREFGAFEGISTHPDGSILLVNQVRKLKKQKAGILFLDSETLEPDGRFIETGIVDQAGIFPVNNEQCYYIISDRKNRLYCYSLTEGLLWDIPLPGETQEGIAVDSEGFFYIAQDKGGLLRLEMEI
ncbi:MAG: SdiA-regulated domain-containing protein [Spirochaetales bacterium]|nr:SdiA-regulated domain-containing protein [Spirochaetales bacterium]